jgi:hypothetical protein
MKKRCCDKETSRRPFFFFRPQILVRFIIHVFFVFQLLPAFIEGTDQFTEGGGLWFFVSFRIFFRTTQELEY